MFWLERWQGGATVREKAMEPHTDFDYDQVEYKGTPAPCEDPRLQWLSSLHWFLGEHIICSRHPRRVAPMAIAARLLALNELVSPSPYP